MKSTLNLSDIDNVIFDLGNVIIRLDIEATTRAFKAIFGSDYDTIMHDLEANDIFNQYEKGQISSEKFYAELNQRKAAASKEELKNAWNAMLLDIPESRYTLLQNAKKSFKLFCLSNTNETHISFINNMLEETKGVPNLDRYFEKVYLSHEMGMRKPDVEIFEKVIDDNELNPKRTLFIDDTLGHLEGAKKAGIQVFHLPSFQLLANFF